MYDLRIEIQVYDFNNWDDDYNVVSPMILYFNLLILTFDNLRLTMYDWRIEIQIFDFNNWDDDYNVD